MNPIRSFKFSVALALACWTLVALPFLIPSYKASPASTLLVKSYFPENMMPSAAASSMAWQAPWDWCGYLNIESQLSETYSGNESMGLTHHHRVRSITEKTRFTLVPVLIWLVNVQPPWHSVEGVLEQVSAVRI